MDKAYQAPGGRLLPTIIIFVFVIGLLYTSFLLIKSHSLKKEIARIEDQKISVQSEINKFKSQQIEEFLNAQSLSEKVKANSIKWSTLIKRIQDLAPVAVFYRSYSGSEDGVVDISALAENYEAVSDTIKALKNAKEFVDVFVPGVTLGKASDGQEIVSFNLELDYNQNE